MTAALLSTVPALPMAMPEIDARQVQIALIYHAHLLAAAIETGVDVRRFENWPRRRLIGQPDWDAAFRARRIAIYLTVTEYDRAGAHTARAANVTKQAVSHLLRQVEDWRDLPETEALLARISARAAGRRQELTA